MTILHSFIFGIIEAILYIIAIVGIFSEDISFWKYLCIGLLVSISSFIIYKIRKKQ